jgi:hypothetical protein
VTINVDSRTLIDDDDDDGRLGVTDIRSGDFLEVEAFLEGERLIATRIDRDDSDDETVQAPVDSFVAGDSITLLGLTYSTAGAEFEDADDRDLTPEQFYAALEAGMLVKVEDEEPADGIADEVEFESATLLDGEREFGDDDYEDDDEDEDEDDDDDEDEEDDDEDEEDDDEDEEDEEDEPDSED